MFGVMTVFFLQTEQIHLLVSLNGFPGYLQMQLFGQFHKPDLGLFDSWASKNGLLNSCFKTFSYCIFLSYLLYKNSVMHSFSEPPYLFMLVKRSH